MAFIKCNKCGARINDKVLVCPRCGNSINKIVNNLIEPRKMQNYSAIIGAFLTIVSIFFNFLTPLSITICIMGIKKSKELNKDGLVLSILCLIVSLLYLFVFIMSFFNQ